MDQIIQNQLKQAKLACRVMQRIDSKTKVQALYNISQALLANVDSIVAANQEDLKHAKENGISQAMTDRLLLNRERIEAIAENILKVIALKDPIGQLVREINRPNGLIIKQIRIPIGVIGVIYESRPNVTVDIVSLCIKTNNVCVLKGGKEAVNTNKELVRIMQEAIAGLLPVEAITLVVTNSHQQVDNIIKANQYLDVVIPRGSARLINYVVNTATVPVIETGAGICHLYIDKKADLNMALKIAVNAKTSRPAVCNAIETILVHQEVAEDFLPALKEAFKPFAVTCYCDEKARAIIGGQLAQADNYATEYDDYICNIKVVKDIDEAIEHIYQYSTKHSESIITQDEATAQYFMESLDSACVYHNASTRFTDGGEFGFGAEVGISTQKIHARGPLGLQEITSTKYLILGNGQIR